MQIRWRKNPKTESGWFKWTAISLLSALGLFVLNLPIAFTLFLLHLKHAYPDDPQNFLCAITSAVATGLAVGAVCFCACMMIFLLLSFRGKTAAL